MSAFNNKLHEFLSKAWDYPEETQLVNALLKNRAELYSDEVTAQQHISEFAQANAAIIFNTSEDFQNSLKILASYAGGLMTEEYHGFWEHVSIGICNMSGVKITPELFDKVRKVAYDSFGIRVRMSETKPKFEMVAPKVEILKMGAIESVLRKVSKDLKVYPITLAPGKHDISKKMNKIEDRRDNELAIARGEMHDIYSESQKHNQPLIMEKRIDAALNKVERMLENNKTGYEKNSIKRFVTENIDKIDSLNEDSEIDSHRLSALVERWDIRENDTSDISVPDTSLSPSLVKKRVENYDPWHSASNKQAGSRALVQFDEEVLKESIRTIDLRKTHVLGTDLLTTNKFSRVIIESAGKKMELTIDREKFIAFVKRNTSSKKYMNEGKFQINKYFQSRTTGFISSLFLEYFASETNGQEKGMQIVDVTYFSNTNQVVIDGSIDGEDFQKEVDADDFFDFCESNDPAADEYYFNDREGNEDFPQGFGRVFDRDNYWSDISMHEQFNWAAKFITSKQTAGKNNLNEASIAKAVDDYNEWKSIIATRSNNNYEIKRANKDSLNSMALNAEGKSLGEWNPNKMLGYIYK
jgi:hypothetical protein